MDRYALLIGVSEYPDAPLLNPVNDVRKLASALSLRGFQCQILENIGSTDLEQALEKFSAMIDMKKCLSLIFFAGHGVELHGAGYIAPADFPLPFSSGKLKTYGMPIVRLLQAMTNAIGGKILIIDACRSQVDGMDRLVSDLDEMRKQESSFDDFIVAYSTSSTEKALDGSGSNSLYCDHLCRTVLEHDLSIEEAIKMAGMHVMQDSNQSQRPWYYCSLNRSISFSDLPRASLFQSFPIVKSNSVRGSALASSNIFSFVCNKSNKVAQFTLAGELGGIEIEGSEIVALEAISDTQLALLLHENRILFCNIDSVAGKEIKLEDATYYGICVSPNNETFVIYGEGIAQVFYRRDAKTLTSLKIGSSCNFSYYCAAYIDDDHVWLSGGPGYIQEISLSKASTEPRQFKSTNYSHLYSIILLPGATEVACLYSGGLVEIRSTTDGEVLKVISLGRSVRTNCAIRSSLADIASDSVIYKYIFDPSSLSEEDHARLSDNLASNNLIFGSAATSLPILAAGSDEGIIYLIDTRDGQVFQTIDTCAGQGRSIEGMCFVEPNFIVVLTCNSIVNYYVLASQK